jgi:hypothetical protein
MTFMQSGTGALGCRCIGMDTLDTSSTLHRLAAKMRRQALETSLPEYQDMMRRVANSLDTEAERIAEQRLLDFSCAFNVISNAQFSTLYH